jgi:chaperonin GroEL
VFINDKSNQQVTMDDGLVVLYDGALNDLVVPAAIQSAVADVAGQYDGRPIIVFAHSFADSVLEKFAKITKSGSIILPIKTPRSGLPNGVSMFLHDLAAYTGAIVFDPGNIQQMERCDLGTFKSAKVNIYETFLYSDSDPEKIEARIQELKSIEKTAFSEFDRAFFRANIARLTGGVSTIWVGGSSDLEAREKKDRVEDAVEAVRSAIAEGIVPGGCVMQLQFSHLLKNHPEKKPSWDILAQALTEPFTLLLSNGGEDVEEVYPLIKDSVEQIDHLPQLVFDADDHQVVTPFSAGIIEPAKVTRVSLENALSVATLLITLGGIVCVERDANIEAQMEMASTAFKNMTNQDE